MKVSVVITEMNEAKSIGRFLDSLLLQTRIPDEIVITDGGSTDGTQQIIQEYIKQGAAIKLIQAPGNRSVGRNTAIKNATHSIIAVTDAGCIIAKNWLEEIIKPFKDDQVMVVAGGYTYSADNLIQKLTNDFIFQNHHPEQLDTWLPSSRSIAFRKEAWKRAGGYPEYQAYNAKLRNKCGGEDTVFDLKLKQQGYSFANGLSAQVDWKPQPTLRKMFKQYYWYAIGDGLDDSGLLDGRGLRRFSAVTLAAFLGIIMASILRSIIPLLLIAPLLYIVAARARRPIMYKGNLRYAPTLIVISLVYITSQALGYMRARVHGWFTRASA